MVPTSLPPLRLLLQTGEMHLALEWNPITLAEGGEEG